jgi:hypothetical protein
VAILRKTEGQLWQAGGKLVRAANASKYVFDHRYPPAPGLTAPVWYKDPICLVDYEDGDLLANGDCSALARPAWDGTLHRQPGWPLASDNRLLWSVSGYVSINNKAGWSTSNGYLANLTLNAYYETPPDYPVYWLWIACMNTGTYTHHFIWRGKKRVCPGMLPVGTYTRYDGDDTTGQIELGWA